MGLKILTEIIVLPLPRMQLFEGFTNTVLVVKLELSRIGEQSIDVYALLRALGFVSVDQLGIAHMPATRYAVNHH